MFGAVMAQFAYFAKGPGKTANHHPFAGEQAGFFNIPPLGPAGRAMQFPAFAIA